MSVRWRSRPYPIPEQPKDRERRLKFQRTQLALSNHAAVLRDEFYGGREINLEDGWDYYAAEGDRRRIAELEAEVAWLEVDPLVRLEASVEHCCQAIYAQCEGYWPTESERSRIALALVASLDLFAAPVEEGSD